jgi:hypothetical protein
LNAGVPPTPNKATRGVYIFTKEQSTLINPWDFGYIKTTTQQYPKMNFGFHKK